MKLIEWNYETAVSQLKPMVEDLHKRTLKVCKLLYQAREALAKQGFRSDLKNVTPEVKNLTSSQMRISSEDNNLNSSAEMQTSSQMRRGSKPKTFLTFLEEIGLSTPTAYRWLASYDPEEDRLLSADEVKQRAEDVLNAIFEEVREHRYNGEPKWEPEKWSQGLEKKYQLWLVQNDYIKVEPQLLLPPTEPEYEYGQLGLFSQEYLDNLSKRTYERTSGDQALKFHKVIMKFEKVVPKGIKPVEVAKLSEMTMVGLEQFPPEVRRQIGISLAEQIRNQVMEEF